MNLRGFVRVVWYAPVNLIRDETVGGFLINLWHCAAKFSAMAGKSGTIRAGYLLNRPDSNKPGNSLG